jgi:hypothetical protein
VRGDGNEAYKTYDLVKESQTFVYVKNLSWIHVQGLNKEAWRIATTFNGCNLFMLTLIKELGLFLLNSLIHFLFI